jgi:hypothetical protein
MPVQPDHKARRVARAVLVIAFGAAGVLHLTLPGPFLAIHGGFSEGVGTPDSARPRRCSTHSSYHRSASLEASFVSS